MPAKPTHEDRQWLINRAGVLTIGLNVALTVARGAAGFLSGSTAVLADAANSGTDILATLVVLGGSRIAARPPDLDHPYGHEKAEPVAAKIVGILVTLTGVLTGIGAIRALGGGGEPVAVIAAWVTAGSILIKEGLARFLVRLGRRVGSQALLADAANQRTDVLASFAALIGALGGRFGLPILDPAMGLLVSGLIIRMGLGLYWQSVRDLMDRAPDPAVMGRIEQAITATPGVLVLHEVKARIFGPSIYVDCKVGVNAGLSVADGHRIAKRVKEAVMRAVPETRNTLVHINPAVQEPELELGDAQPIHQLVPGELPEFGQPLHSPPDGRA